MGIKEVTAFMTGALWPSRSREFPAALMSAPAAAVVVDLPTVFFSLFAQVEAAGGTRLADVFGVVRRYLDRLFAVFEIVAVCIDLGSPACKGVEQAKRRSRQDVRPLGAAERAALMEHGVLSPDAAGRNTLARIRASRGTYRFVRRAIAHFVATEYRPPAAPGGTVSTFYAMGHPDAPGQLEWVRSDGTSGANECPVILESDGQVVWLADALGVPAVVVSNDRDVEALLRLRWLLVPRAREHAVFHYRNRRRLMTFLNPAISDQHPAPAAAAGPIRTDVFGAAACVAWPAAAPVPRKKRSVYEAPFADIRAQMLILDDESGWARALHLTLVEVMFGCDYVHKTTWVSGISGDTVWAALDAARPELVAVDGDGPFRVRVDAAALTAFLGGVFRGRKRVRTKPGFAATLRRTLWTLVYMCNMWLHPTAVPDPLEQVDGVPVWGWAEGRGGVEEAAAVSAALPPGCLGEMG